MNDAVTFESLDQYLGSIRVPEKVRDGIWPQAQRWAKFLGMVDDLFASVIWNGDKGCEVSSLWVGKGSILARLDTKTSEESMTWTVYRKAEIEAIELESQKFHPSNRNVWEASTLTVNVRFNSGTQLTLEASGKNCERLWCFAKRHILQIQE